MIELIMIPKKELALLTNAKSSSLTSRDGELLVEYGDVFEKFLRKTQFSYQISLSEGKYRGTEEAIYNKIEGINEVITSLKGIGDTMQSYHDKKAEEAEKKA